MQRAGERHQGFLDDAENFCLALVWFPFYNKNAVGQRLFFR